MSEKLKSQIKSLAPMFVILFLATIITTGMVLAYSGSNSGTVIETCDSCIVGGGDSGEGILGGVTFSDEYFKGDVYMEEDATVDGELTVTGAISSTAGVIVDTGSITATTTLTTTSGNVQLLGTSALFTTITLPAVADGQGFEFIVTGALTGEEAIIKSAEGDNISGIIQVGNTTIACSLEDQVNIITDGEVIGDNVSFISDGTSWYLSGGHASSTDKMTCTDPS